MSGRTGDVRHSRGPTRTGHARRRVHPARPRRLGTVRPVRRHACRGRRRPRHPPGADRRPARPGGGRRRRRAGGGRCARWPSAARRLRMSRATVRGMDGRGRWQQIGWALPWLLFQAFSLADLIGTPRPVGVRVVAAVGLLVFTVVYLGVFRRAFGGCGPVYRRLLAVAVLGTALAVWLGQSWAGLMTNVAPAAGVPLPTRWVFPAALGAAGICAAVVGASGQLGDLFILPVSCVLTAFALQGTRHLMSVNAELTEARDELARNAVAEERLRFARDLHDLLGHSLSLIALKSELAGRLAERDPVRAREEMADVEAAARRALAEVRDAVSGYRQVSFAQALVEARSALSGAGIVVRADAA